MKYQFIQEQEGISVRLLCSTMQVSPSAYYAWLNSPSKLITAEELHLYRRAKKLFEDSRESLGSRELSKKLKQEGLDSGRYKILFSSVVFQL